MVDSVEQFATEYFREIANTRGFDYEDMLSVYFIDDKLLDSFGVVSMITDFESKFDIAFSNDDFQSDDFKTVGGLVRLIQAKLK